MSQLHASLDLPADLQAAMLGSGHLRLGSDVGAHDLAELDSFGPLQATSLPGHDTLFALAVVRRTH